MEMHQVRYFLAAAKALSFTRAAEACRVSQPALTTAIKKLEAQLGGPLFHREGRQAALTEFGRRMQPHLSQILEQAKAAETVAEEKCARWSWACAQTWGSSFTRAFVPSARIGCRPW